MGVTGLFLLSLFSTACVGRMVLPSFHWNQRNALFKKNQTPRRPCTEPAHLYVEPRAELYFICPHIVLDMAPSKDRLTRDTLYENIHLVSKTGYETCTVDLPNSLLVKCDKSERINQLKYEILIFNIVTWNDWQFLPNRTYYFIDTSNGTREGLDNKSGGKCKTHNMKLKITVCLPGQKCGKCENMCCEKPATKPPTTTVQTTAETTTTTVSSSSVKKSPPVHTSAPNKMKPTANSTTARTASEQAGTVFVATKQSNSTLLLSKVKDTQKVENPVANTMARSNCNGGKSDSLGYRILYVCVGIVCGIVISFLAFYVRRCCQTERNPSNCEKEAGSPRDSKVDRMCPRKRNSPRTDNVFARLQSVSSTASTGSSADTIPYEAGKLLPQHV